MKVRILLKLWPLLIVSPITSGTVMEFEYLTKSVLDGSTLSSYFACTVEGSTLQWVVNRMALGGYSVSSSPGSVLSSTRQTFYYTSTLLAVGPAAMSSQKSFVSVLMVTVQRPINFNVACLTETDQRIKSVMLNVESFYTTSPPFQLIYLEKIINSKLLKFNQTLNTAIFFCAVQGTSQTFQINRQQYKFESSDLVGSEIHNLFSDQGYMVLEDQAILVAKYPFTLISIAIATISSDITVVCMGDSERKNISSGGAASSTTSLTTMDATTTASITSKLV